MTKKLFAIIYWLGVALIPFLVWLAKYIDELRIKCSVEGNCSATGNLEYWPIILTYISLFLLPLCVYKIYFSLKNIFENNENEA